MMRTIATRHPPSNRGWRSHVVVVVVVVITVFVSSRQIVSAWTYPTNGNDVRANRPRSSSRDDYVKKASPSSSTATWYRQCSSPRRPNGDVTISASSSSSSSSTASSSSSAPVQARNRQSTNVIDRRRVILPRIVPIAAAAAATTAFSLMPFQLMIPPQSAIILPAWAYTPDIDPLRESLYLMSRVQEATVQQERFVDRAIRQEILKSKMKLTLNLVEKNYRILDQVTYASGFVTPYTNVVEATNAGYEAAEALQNAIDYVNLKDGGLGYGPFADGQKEYLKSNLRMCRERLFDFLSYMPQEKLDGARKRVEEENVANRDEFDGDSDAGVYNPVVLPWKGRG